MHKINEWLMAHFFELILVLSMLCLGWVALSWFMA